MKRDYILRTGDILFSKNNGVYYRIMGKRNADLWDAETWFEDENGEIVDIENGYITRSEINRLVHEMTGINQFVIREE